MLDTDRLRAIRRRWSATIGAMLGPATDTMLENTVATGMAVLDIAAGAGDQTVRAAQRVGVQGLVEATDIAGPMLDFAASEARTLGLSNVTFRAMPCEELDEADESFDAVICRNGLQYVADLATGLAEIYRVLRANGMVGAIVWSSADKNLFLSASFETIYRKMNVRSPRVGEPGPFGLGDEGHLRSAFGIAGFRDVALQTISAPTRFRSADDALTFQQEAGGELVRLMSGLSESDQNDAWREIGETLRSHERDGRFELDGELLIATAKK